MEYSIVPIGIGLSLLVCGDVQVEFPTKDVPAGEQARDAFAVEWIGNHYRNERNFQLSMTDYLMMPDYPLTEEHRAAWAAYRQALRDVPEQVGFPVDVVWPVKPGL